MTTADTYLDRLDEFAASVLADHQQEVAAHKASEKRAKTILKGLACAGVLALAFYIAKTQEDSNAGPDAASAMTQEDNVVYPAAFATLRPGE